MGATSAAKSGPGLPRGIFKRGAHFWIRVRDADGKLVRRSCGPRLGDALAERDRLVRERAQRRAAGPTSLPVLVRAWLARHELRSRARTIQGARQAAKRLLDEFGNVDVRRLTEVRLADYVRRRRCEVGVESVNKDVRALKAVLRLAVRQHVLPALPFYIELLPAPLKKKIPQAIPPAKFQRLLTAADELDAGKRHPLIGPILRVAYVTGLRHQELLHLEKRPEAKPKQVAIKGRDKRR
jgi:integrase